MFPLRTQNLHLYTEMNRVPPQRIRDLHICIEMNRMNHLRTQNLHNYVETNRVPPLGGSDITIDVGNEKSDPASENLEPAYLRRNEQCAPSEGLRTYHL